MIERSRCFFRQVRVLLARNAELLLNSTSKLVLMLALPIVCGVIVAFVAGEDMFTSFQDSQTAYFVLCCAVIFTGVFNSIQDICKERSIVRREYCANLKLGAYISSKLCMQAVICAVQAFLIMVIFVLFADFSKSSDGLLLPVVIECYITLFLLTLASDATGLFISSMVKSADIANIIAPVFLILQVVFSGVLFSMNRFLEITSFFMVARWAMQAFGSSSDIARELREAQDEALSAGYTLNKIELDFIDMYEPSASSLLVSWGMLFSFVIAFSVFAALMLRRVSKDTR